MAGSVIIEVLTQHRDRYYPVVLPPLGAGSHSQDCVNSEDVSEPAVPLSHRANARTPLKSAGSGAKVVSGTATAARKPQVEQEEY